MADVTVDFRGFEELQKRIAELNSFAMEEANRQSMKEMAAVYLAEAKRATPTKGVQTVERNGTTITTNSEHMKRSWSAGAVEQNGREYKIKVFNTASTLLMSMMATGNSREGMFLFLVNDWWKTG